jgi:hypothetical protein
MVHTPTAPAMLDTWERGLGQGPVQRGLTLLALAFPGDDPDALAALSVGERDRRLLALREVLFGARSTGLVACPRCGEQVELEFALGDLRAAPPAPGPLVLSGDDHELHLRLPDSRDLLAAAAAGEDDAPLVLLSRCVVAGHVGSEPARADRLSPELVAAAGRALAQADPQADMRFALTCPACGNGWSAPFDVVPFLWTELDAWAGRTLADVHALAGAYGWSEAEILALAPGRRASYLRMVGA